MNDLKCITLVFLHDELEPIDERVIHPLVRAKTRNADSLVGKGPLFRGGQVQARTKDADMMSSRC